MYSWLSVICVVVCGYPRLCDFADSTDIIDSRIKLILGLIWTLILHYSISMPLWEDEGDYGPPGTREGPTPKQRLLIWVQNKIPELPVRNFTTDWNDGKAIGALVDAVGPGGYCNVERTTSYCMTDRGRVTPSNALRMQLQILQCCQRGSILLEV